VVLAVVVVVVDALGAMPAGIAGLAVNGGPPDMARVVVGRIAVTVVLVCGLTRPGRLGTVVVGRGTDVVELEAPATDITARRGGEPRFPDSVTAIVTTAASTATVAAAARILRRRCT
jgi:hypothetical protein